LELLYPLPLLSSFSYLCQRNIHLFSNSLFRIGLIAVSSIPSHSSVLCLYGCETFLIFQGESRGNIHAFNLSIPNSRNLKGCFSFNLPSKFHYILPSKTFQVILVLKHAPPFLSSLFQK